MAIERIERRPLDDERLGALRELFPEVFTDGRVDVDRLRELLDGEAAEAAPGDEHYGLEWPGKRAARKQASRPATGTLRPAPGEGVDESTTKNLLIVGDNLEVLRLLQKSYAGQVKLIYIDPPYNTGNDFIYKDDFKEPVEVYLEATKQADLSGVLTSNPKSGGRFHSQWLSMMYPRLVLARQLLREDGVIFVSIDDNEVQGLRLLMDEILGQECFVAQICVVNNMKGRNDRKHIATTHEYLLMYAMDEFDSDGIPLSDQKIGEYNKTDESGRKFQWRDLRKRGGADTRKVRPNLYFPLYVDQSTGTVRTEEDRKHSLAVYPSKSDDTEGCWRWGRPRTSAWQTRLRAQLANTGRWNIAYPVYLEEEGEIRSAKPKSTWIGPGFSTDSATKRLAELLGPPVGFTPKPVGLIEQILHLATEQDSLVLDFFAGSGTTGEAVMKLNVEDGGNRRFILVQLPEVTGHGDYKTIDRITRARLAAASKALAAESKQMELGAAAGADLGFRVLRLDQSNVIRWVPYEGTDPTALPGLFQAHNGLVAGWKPENLLVEVMLLEGYPLDSALAENPAFRENRVITVSNPGIPARLLVCLDGEITDDTVETLGDFKDDIFVCCEGALTDVTKVRIADVIRNVKTL